MKKFVYLCGMILLSMNMMAQIDTCDMNWEPVLIDDFDQPNRQFNNTFQEPSGKWISYAHSLWPSGVTKIPLLHIYQWNKCQIDASNGVINLNSNYIRSTPVSCNEQPNYYILPPNTFGMNYHCDDENNELYYYSGMIESLPTNKFRYGYFEIKCKLPVHRGAFPAFWLWDAKTDEYYEEIDIFEFSWEFEDPLAPWQINSPFRGAGYPYSYSTGLFYNDTSAYYGGDILLSRVIPTLTDSVSNWHTFACEWLPDHVIWYCDGKIVNEYHNRESIPRHAMALKVNYAIDRYALSGYSHNGIPDWQENGCMVIDHINVYQLKWDCSTDEVITNQSELEHFDYAVKNSITIAPANQTVEVGNTDKVTFRATDSFQISNPFQVDNGGEMTVIMQQCPE